MFNSVLFASGPSFGGAVFVLACVAPWIGWQIYKAIVEHDLRQRDPQAYVRLKEIESQEKQRQHDKKMAGFKLGQSIGRWFFR